jgi:hypothetical protein
MAMKRSARADVLVDLRDALPSPAGEDHHRGEKDSNQHCGWYTELWDSYLLSRGTGRGRRRRCLSCSG